MNEIDLASWLLHHREGLEVKIKAVFSPSAHIYPSNMQDIYQDMYVAGIVELIKSEITHSFNLTPEQICENINKEFIIKVLGKEFLAIPKQQTIKG